MTATSIGMGQMDTSARSNVQMNPKWKKVVEKGVKATVRGERKLYVGYVYNGIFFYIQGDEVKAVKLDQIKSPIHFSNPEKHPTMEGLWVSDMTFLFLTEMEDAGMLVENDQTGVSPEFVNSVIQKVQSIAPTGSNVHQYQDYGTWDQGLPALMKNSLAEVEQDKTDPNSVITFHVVNKVLVNQKLPEGSHLAKVNYKYESMKSEDTYGAICIQLQDQSGDKRNNVNNYLIGAIVITHPDKRQLFQAFGV